MEKDKFSVFHICTGKAKNRSSRTHIAFVRFGKNKVLRLNQSALAHMLPANYAIILVNEKTRMIRINPADESTLDAYKISNCGKGSRKDGQGEIKVKALISRLHIKVPSERISLFLHTEGGLSFRYETQVVDIPETQAVQPIRGSYAKRY